MKCQVNAIQWGGVVAEFFGGLRKPTRFSGGGSSRIFFFSVSSKLQKRFSGGGSTMNFPLMGPFYIFRLSRRPPPLNRPLHGIDRQNCVLLLDNLYYLFLPKLDRNSNNLLQTNCTVCNRHCVFF